MRTLPLPFAAIAAVATLSAAAGCGGAAADASMLRPSRETYQLYARAQHAKPWAPSTQEPVTLEITAPTQVRANERVSIKIRLHNGSVRPIAIGFGQRHTFDIVVATTGAPANATPVWSPPTGGAATFGREATITDAIRPGHDTTFDVVWPGQDDTGRTVPPGRYQIRGTVTAELLSTHEIWTPWVPLEVRP